LGFLCSVGAIAHPGHVPDLGHQLLLRVSGETDGTEGSTKTISEGEDLGGEDSPSTTRRGGSLVGPETSGSRLGIGEEVKYT